MSNDFKNLNGDFTKNLFSLQLQIKTLLDGAGGDDASSFLDKLSNLSSKERTIILKVFQKALDRLNESGIELSSVKDDQLKDFENGLYNNLIDGMNALKHDHFTHTLSVIDGGKLPTKKKKEVKTVCLAEARKRLRDGDVRQKHYLSTSISSIKGHIEDPLPPVIN